MASPPGPPPVVTSTARTSTKNLLQQLPAGAVLAFQALAGTFTNSGKCHYSNKWLTGGLVIVLSATCIFFSFTDSLVFQGKIYYGVAVPGRLNILNMPKKKERVVFRSLKPELKKRGLKADDWLHGVLSLVVFLTIAGSDVGLQNCFFPAATEDTRQWLRNLPLGMAVMTSFLFMIFPTTRKGITLDNSSPPAADAQDKKEDDGGKEPAAADRAITSTASLMHLLPTGPVLAFQTLAASFTNQGQCHHSNYFLTVGLVTFLGATCIFSSFTDCIPDRKTGKVHKGVALPRTLYILGMSKKDHKEMFDKSALKERRLKTMDWVHAFFTAVVFLTIAGRDVGLQNCFFPDAGDDTRQLLTNLPLGVAVMSSFVFIIFPTTRNVMGFDDSDYIVIIPTEGQKDPPPTDDGQKDSPPTDDGQKDLPPTDGQKDPPPTNDQKDPPPTPSHPDPHIDLEQQ